LNVLKREVFDLTSYEDISQALMCMNRSVGGTMDWKTMFDSLSHMKNHGIRAILPIVEATGILATGGFEDFTAATFKQTWLKLVE
jgi:hypothetical protein